MINSITIKKFMGTARSQTATFEPFRNNVIALSNPDCDITSTGMAVHDLSAHLGYFVADYSCQRKNLNANADIYEIEANFTFNGLDITYAYGKKESDRTIYEVITIDGKKVAEIDRRESHIAFIDLDGAETLRRDVSSNERISMLPYIKNNSVLANTPVNEAFLALHDYCYDIRFCGFSYSEYSLKSNECPMLLKAAQFIKKNDLIDELNEFLSKFGSPHKLYISDSWGELEIRVRVSAENTCSATKLLSDKELALIYVFYSIKYPSSLLVLDDACKYVYRQKEVEFFNFLEKNSVGTTLIIESWSL